jgi:thiol-disulfide isomerase/thioredoxin
MSSLKKGAVLLLSTLLLTGCSTAAASSVSSASSASSDQPMGCEWNTEQACSPSKASASTEPLTIGEKADMSGYESYDADAEYVFVNSDVKHMISRMQAGDTFVTYFGFSNCPWCRDAMPILNAVALEKGYEVDYVNTRLDPSWKSNLDLKNYDQLVEAIGDLFPLDDDNKPHMDVPFVVFFKDGKAAYSASYPQYDAHERTINEEEAQQERTEYTAGFDALQ